MKKVIIKSLLLILAGISVKAQPGPYNLAAVPEAVKNKASIITHFENIDVEVESIDKVTLSVHKIFTVVNEEGKDNLIFNEYTSKYITLEEAEIKVYDANGKQTGKYKKKDMRTVATGEGLIEDGFVTYYRISTSVYPVTVELKYEIKYKSALFIPGFSFIHPEEGVVESNYTARVPVEIGLRYKAKNTSIEPVVTDEGKYKVYKWSVKNLVPMEYEEGAVSGRARYPQITIVSDKFSYHGFEGDLSSWKSYGLWMNGLYKDLDVLPADRQQFFLQLVKDASSEKEKIKKIYNYLQDNFRYVSIQLGIGGFRPFSAEFTDKKKYGDCKALSNYMKAALKTVGIKSYVALINAEYNQEPVDPDFPADNFNHVILCVPGPKDSVWLECTSSTAEFGELGTFTENRNALLITDNGGLLVPTPKSHSHANILSTVTTVTISDDLSGLTETVFTSKGAFRERMNDILKESKDHQKEILVFYFGFKQPDEFALAKDESADGHKIKLIMAVRKVQEFNAGNKLFISPRMYKMWSGKLPKAENRKLDFYFRFPFEKNDTTIFKLLPGIKPDALPKENELKCNYASYRSKYWYNEAENSIYSATTFILKQHKVLAADYALVKKFFDDITQDDSQRIVVQKAAAEKKAF
jgi:hypothetical protein